MSISSERCRDENVSGVPQRGQKVRVPWSDEANDRGSPDVQRNARGGTENQVTKGAPLVRRQTEQWQFASSNGVASVSYRTNRQKQPPVNMTGEYPLTERATASQGRTREQDRRAVRDLADKRVRYGLAWCSVKTELIGSPTIVGTAVEVKIRVARAGKFDEFLVTMRAPVLWQYVPPVADVRWAIERVLAEHHAELRAKFDQIWSTAHAVRPSRPAR